MRKKCLLKTVLSALSIAAFFNVTVLIVDVVAFFQPDYQNRCNTNFLDGYLPQGFIFHQFYYNYDSNGLRIRDHRAPGKYKLNVNVSLTQLLYVSPIKFLGGNWGGEIIVPYIHGHVRTPAVSDTDSGTGDTFLATFIQSDKKELSFGNTAIPFYWRLRILSGWIPKGFRPAFSGLL